MSNFKKKVKEKIKQYSKDEYLAGYIQNEYLTKDGDADIYLNINSLNDLFDVRTSGNQLDLNSSVYNYIESKSAMLSNDTILNLHISGAYLNDKEQGMVKHIIKEHYAIELYKVQKKHSKYRNKIIGLLLIGIIALICYFKIYFIEDFNLLLEVFGFIFSFALWEAGDCLIYTLSDIKTEREAITQNLLMNVEFDD